MGVNIDKAKLSVTSDRVSVKLEHERHIYAVYYYKPTKRYYVANIREGSQISYFPEEFVYGSALYNETVAWYPNYVHKQLWMLYEYCRGL